MNSSKAKGDRAELEVQQLLRDLGFPAARRKLGAGRRDDMGDIDGIPDHVIQVCDWTDVRAAIRHKPVDADEQRINAGVAHAATFVRLRGGVWRVVLTPDQWAGYARPSQESPPTASEGRT